MKLFKIVMLGLFAFLLTACNEVNPDKNPTFGDIEWGDDRDTVKERIKELGFHAIGVTGSNSIEFRGQFMDAPMEGLVIFTDDGASKIVLSITPGVSSGKFFSTYDRILAVMKEKYGEPTIFMHDAGDSEVEIIKLLNLENSRQGQDGEYHWADFWEVDERGGGFGIQIERDSIMVRYESIAFGEAIHSMDEKRKNAL